MAADEDRIEMDGAVQSEPVSGAVTVATGYARRSRRRKWIILGILLLLLSLLAYSVVYFDANRRLPLPRLVSATAVDVPQYLYSISGEATETLSAPIGVAVSRDSRVYVVDTRARAVKVFSTAGVFLSKFSAIDDGRFKTLRTPVHLALDPSGNVWVTDRTLGALYVFSPNGKFLRKIIPNGDPKFLWAPLGITIDAAGDVYVSDVPNVETNRVLVLDSKGTVKAAFGRAEEVLNNRTGPGALSFPNGVVISPGSGDGRDLYVADSNNRRVQVFSPSGTFKRFVISQGTPRGIALDAKSRLYVVDVLSHQVDIFSAKGQHVASFGGSGVGPGQFQYPEDIALDARGRIYISDRANDQIQVWGYPEAEIPGVTKVTRAQVPWCLAPLALLFLPLFFRRRRFVVTPDFVEGMVLAELVPSMVNRRWRWIVSQEMHAPFAGRVVDGVDLGELIEPEPYSRSDATDLASRLGIPLERAGVLAMAKRYKRLCTEDSEFARLAVLLGIDVYDRSAFLERFARGRRR